MHGGFTAKSLDDLGPCGSFEMSLTPLTIPLVEQSVDVLEASARS